MDVSKGEPYLDAALASLAAQSFPDFEIVLCAHGATPATEAIIANWEVREPRMRVLRNAKLPLAQAHNLVANAARGCLLARLDADDIAKPDRLEQQVQRFRNEPTLGFLGSAIDLIDETGRHLSQVRNPLGHAEIESALRDSCPMVHSTMMVRTELFHQAGGYREGLNISEDYDLYCRMIEHGRAANIEAALVEYRVHGQSITSRRTLRMAITNEAVRAAAVARANGLTEPFARGVPCLRKIAAMPGRSRNSVRRDVIAIASQSRTSRLLLSGPLPVQLGSRLRNLALGIGLRPVYSFLFKALSGLIDFRERRLRGN